ncbi:MAG: nucleotide exchange factor GrpE [Chloroflexota bacterium]|nr:nucleotide exchange factor GrpE [Chloroflexota bacterium]
MSDVKDPTEELEKENEDELSAAPEAAEEAPPEGSADESGNTEEEAPELPEGINLMQAFIEAQQEAQSNKDGWQRARAEFANYKKRIERERIEVFQRASLDTLKALLPIVDDFDRAFESLPEDISDNPWIGGVSMIQRKFVALLEQYEVEAIDPTGDLFDPNLHQAIGTEESDEIESGHVTETLQKGYRAGEQILRLALVKVAS